MKKRTPHGPTKTLPTSNDVNLEIDYSQSAIPNVETIWSRIESIPHLCAVRAEWARGISEQFPQLRAFLQQTDHIAQSVPCPRYLGLYHKVIHCRDGSILDVCESGPPLCPPLNLKPDDLIIWELSWPKLSHAISKALGLQGKPADLGLPNTAQIGAWSSDGIPAILTIQYEQSRFKQVVASLVAVLQEAFILLAPTSKHMDAPSLACLAKVSAQFLPLETVLILGDHGLFQPAKSPGEIFHRFAPDPANPLGEAIAQQVLALASRLDARKASKPPTLLATLLMYCSEGLSAAQIAHKSGCSKGTVINRLNVLRKELGRNPAELRRYSSHLEAIKSSLTDPRARRVYHKAAILGQDDAQE